MAIQWGAWEDSGGNGIRVGIEIEGWTAGDQSPGPNNDDGQAQTFVSFYTENRYSYGDDQHLSFGGAFGGGTNFYNGAGGSPVQRDRKKYEYNYGANEYGTSPGKVTFTVSLSGAYNGVTPSKSVTVDIPARPIAAPDAPTNASTAYISDTSLKTTWTNKDTSAKPWDVVHVDRQVNNGDWVRAANLSGGATSYTDSTQADTEYQYRVRSSNSEGSSDWVYTDTIWTTPAAPRYPSRTTSGSDQVVSWSNWASTNDYETEVWRAVNGVWSLLTVVDTFVSTYTDTTASITDQVKYKMRARNKLGYPIRYSDFSSETSETLGATSPPNAPTNLSPDGALVIPTQDAVLSWQHNPIDTSSQTSFAIRWRESGTTVWNNVARVYSAVESWTAVAGTFPSDTEVEWAVQTWGADASPSVYSTAATFTTTTNPNALRESKRPLVLDVDTGQTETAPLGVLPPVGSLTMFAGAATPTGWLACEGQVLSRSTYSDLFAVIGTQFNTGGESSLDFRLPDLRDRMPLGASLSKPLGGRGGSETKTLGIANMPSHNHGTAGSHVHDTGHGPVLANSTTTFASGRLSDKVVDNNLVQPAGDHSHNYEGGNQAFDVMNPWLAVSFIIKT